jgi:hypothetical protein
VCDESVDCFASSYNGAASVVPVVEHCPARPAWERTLRMYAERLGVKLDDIR